MEWRSQEGCTRTSKKSIWVWRKWSWDECACGRMSLLSVPRTMQMIRRIDKNVKRFIKELNFHFVSNILLSLRWHRQHKFKAFSCYTEHLSQRNDSYVIELNWNWKLFSLLRLWRDLNPLVRFSGLML